MLSGIDCDKTMDIPKTGWGESAYLWCIEKLNKKHIFNYCGVDSKYGDSIYFFDYLKGGKGNHHDFYGNENRYGQIVLDYRCSIDPPTTNLILHGHHMKDGSMFGSLKKYKRKSYWKEHRYIHFDTIYEEGIYEIFAVFLSKVYYQNEDVFKYYNFVNAESEEEFNYFYENVKKLTNFSTGVVPKYGDSILTLSTCEYSQENGRLVVVARKLSADEIAALAETETEAEAEQKGTGGLNDE